MPSPAKLIDILLVEDNECDVELTRCLFNEARIGNHLHVVRDGDEALDFIYQRNAWQNGVRPDIILLDLNLPQKDGREIVQILKKDPLARNIPIVILTGAAMDDTILAACEIPPNCYISKPVTFFSFFKAIQSLEEFWLGLVTLPAITENKLAS